MTRFEMIAYNLKIGENFIFVPFDDFIYQRINKDCYKRVAGIQYTENGASVVLCEEKIFTLNISDEVKLCKDSLDIYPYNISDIIYSLKLL